MVNANKVFLSKKTLNNRTVYILLTFGVLKRTVFCCSFSELAIVREGFFVVRVATFQAPQLRPSDSAGTRAFQDGDHTL